jgi:hypothetical protein
VSDTENSRPGLTSAESPSFGTDRGDVWKWKWPEISEPPCKSSYQGVTVYETVHEPRESDNRLRRLLAMSIIAIIGLAALAGLIAHMCIAIHTGSADSMNSFIDGLFKTLIPLVTLFVGYLCGKNAKNVNNTQR